MEALLNSGATRLVISLEFAKKQGFKLKRLERPINVRNVDGSTYRVYGRGQYLLSEI